MTYAATLFIVISKDKKVYDDFDNYIHIEKLPEIHKYIKVT